MPEPMFGGIPDAEPTLDRKRSAWVATIILVLLLSLSLVQFLATPKTVRWSVTGGKLQIHSRVWSDDFPLRDMQLDQTSILDLNREPGWRPQGKIWGFNGFGFNAGRFKLRNGQSADLYLTNETTGVLIPRRGDVPVIVGVRDPQALLAALKGPALSNPIQ